MELLFTLKRSFITISFQEAGLSFIHKYKKFVAHIAVIMSVNFSFEINYNKYNYESNNNNIKQIIINIH